MKNLELVEKIENSGMTEYTREELMEMTNIQLNVELDEVEARNGVPCDITRNEILLSCERVLAIKRRN